MVNNTYNENSNKRDVSKCDFMSKRPKISVCGGFVVSIRTYAGARVCKSQWSRSLNEQTRSVARTVDDPRSYAHTHGVQYETRASFSNVSND